MAVKTTMFASYFSRFAFNIILLCVFSESENWDEEVNAAPQAEFKFGGGLSSKTLRRYLRSCAHCGSRCCKGDKGQARKEKVDTDEDKMKKF